MSDELLMIVAIDTQVWVGASLPQLDELVREGPVVLDECEVVRYPEDSTEPRTSRWWSSAPRSARRSRPDALNQPTRLLSQSMWRITLAPDSRLQFPERADRHGAQLGAERESVLTRVQNHTGDEVIPQSILEMP